MIHESIARPKYCGTCGQELLDHTIKLVDNTKERFDIFTGREMIENVVRYIQCPYYSPYFNTHDQWYIDELSKSIRYIRKSPRK